MTRYLLAVILMGWGNAWGVMPYQATPTEIALLPKYCQIKYGAATTPAEIASFDAFFIHSNWNNMHHYCDAVRFIFRSDSLLAKDKVASCFWLGHSIKSLERNINGEMTRDWPLMAEAYTYLGQAYNKLGRCNKDGRASAASAFLKAIQHEPGYPRAYSELARYFSDAKQHDKALKTVSQGLMQSPGNKELQRLYTRFGGKLPFPEPASPPPQSEPKGSVTADAADNSGVTKAVTAIPEEKSAQITPPDKLTPSKKEPVEVPQSGPSGSPWCRFCP